MSDQPRENTFQYEHSPREVAGRLAHLLDAASRVLVPSCTLFEDQSKQRGQLFIVLSELERVIEDADLRVTELSVAAHAEKDIQDGGL